MEIRQQPQEVQWKYQSDLGYLLNYPNVWGISVQRDDNDNLVVHIDADDESTIPKTVSIDSVECQVKIHYVKKICPLNDGF